MSTPIPVMRPQGPSLETLRTYLESIEETRIYSNWGPLGRTLQERIAEYAAVKPENVALFSSGTSALEAAISTIGRKGDLWEIPDFTFVATGLAVLRSERRGLLADVDEQTWSLVPDFGDFVESPTGTICVAPFGSAPIWGEIKYPTRPLIIDAAACFDELKDCGDHLSDQTLVMFSMHATKALTSGEGGVIIGPEGWVSDATVWSNFGFRGERRSTVPGINAKLSEYHAAVGLASLDEWQKRREDLIEVRRNLRSALGRESKQLEPSLQGDVATTTFNLRLDGLSVTALAEHLRKDGIETRQWWPLPLSEQEAFGAFLRPDDLSNARALSQSVIGLPLSVDLKANEITRIADGIRKFEQVTTEVVVS